MPSGIVCVEESGKLSWFAALRNLFSGGVARIPNGPTDQMHLGFAKIGKRLKRYKCRVCDVYFWSWRKRKICYKFACFRKRNEPTKQHRVSRVVPERGQK